MPKIPEIPEPGPDQGFRIEFNVLAFTRGKHISPQRIEDAIIETLKDLDSFGYVRDLCVTRSEVQ